MRLNGVPAIAAVFTASSSTNNVILTANNGGAPGMILVSIGTTGGATCTVGGSYVSTITATGTTGAGPTATVVVNGNSVAYTYLAGDSSTTIAAASIASAINANGTVNVLVKATSTGNVIALDAINGLSYSLATNNTGGATLGFSSEPDFPNLVIPLTTFAYPAYGGSMGLLTFVQGEPREVSAGDRAAMKVQGLVA